MKSLREKKSWVKDFNSAKSLYEDLEVIYEFFKDDEATSVDVEERYASSVNAIEKLEVRQESQLRPRYRRQEL